MFLYNLFLVEVRFFVVVVVVENDDLDASLASDVLCVKILE